MYNNDDLQRMILSKEIFLQKYVLNRASAVRGSLGGRGAAEEAIEAWFYIQREMKKDDKVQVSNAL